LRVPCSHTFIVPKYPLRVKPPQSPFPTRSGGRLPCHRSSTKSSSPYTHLPNSHRPISGYRDTSRSPPRAGRVCSFPQSTRFSLSFYVTLRRKTMGRGTERGGMQDRPRPTYGLYDNRHDLSLHSLIIHKLRGRVNIFLLTGPRDCGILNYDKRREPTSIEERIMGKGSRRRPCQVSRAEYDLRHDLAFGMITRREFDRRMAKLHESDKNQKGSKGGS